MILSLKRPENHLICILSSVPSQKRPGGIGILFFWHFFCIKLKITMKVFYFLNGILISFLVLIMSASTVQSKSLSGSDGVDSCVNTESTPIYKTAMIA